ncbi:MAG: response regulator, partial [Gammaproteobacteria bacterium]
EEPAEEEPAEEFSVEEERRDAEGNILVPRMDPTLYNIFSNEVSDHLQVIKDSISESDKEILVSEEMVRAMHTLAGSARMAAAEEVADIGGALDKFIHKLQEQQTALNQGEIQVLLDGIVQVEKVIEAVGDERMEMPDVSEYQQRLNELLRGFDAEAAMDKPRPEAIAADVDPDLVQLFVEEADDILAFLETTVHTWESSPYDGSVVAELHRSLHTLKGGARLARFDGIGTLSHILETVSIDIAEKRIEATHHTFEVIHQAFDRLVNMVGMAKDGLNAPLPDDIVVKLENLSVTEEARSAEEVTVSVQPEQQDMELVEVFLEEGDEILAAGQGVLQRWIEAPDNIDLIVEMQRALHTLKGGARMAGFWTIGNLGHALETLLIEVLEGRLSTGAEFFDVLESSYDHLGDMLNNAKNGRAVDEADDILKMLESLKKGEKVEIPLQKQKSAVEAAITQALEEKKEIAPEPAEEIQAKPVAQSEVVRVKADLLDDLVNYAGEISIYRARTEQQVSGFRSHLEEMDQTVSRLSDQLRKLEIETEAQILFRHEREHEANGVDDFDPLELDRFSQIQQVSRAIAETLNDINSITDFMDLLARDAETLLLQQSRVNTELQEGLVHSRMVPFSNLVPRMRRVVRQTCQELDKEAQIKIIGAQGEMDRTVLERITAPLEHMLRNAIAHGIEAPDKRAKVNKDRSGTLSVTLTREGPDIVIKVADDGGGINHEAIRAKAQALGWMKQDDYLSDSEVAQFILETGFSTAEAVTQIAGRGVGMDVVNNEIKQLGGTLHIQSEQGKGTEFTIRLPFTLAINHALLVNAAEETYAIPLSSIDGVVRLTHEQLKEFYGDKGASSYEYAGQFYQVINMSALLGIGTPLLPGVGKRAPVVLVQTGDHRFALQVDGLLGSREIVVKAVGPQISSIPGVMGATILGNGSVVLILDIGALSRISLSGGVESLKEVKESDDEITSFTAMVVDDSITVRRVGARLLERNGFDVVTAKDGVDAITVLQERIPDIMLLDIEMPRMDGFELATHMKNDDRLKDIPIIMITSRTGEKHRERAKRIGVEHYLGKPYQENELLQKILELLRITPKESD